MRNKKELFDKAGGLFLNCFVLILVLSFNCTLLSAKNQQYDFLSELENQETINPERDMFELFLSNFFDTIPTVNCNNITAIEGNVPNLVIKSNGQQN